MDEEDAVDVVDVVDVVDEATITAGAVVAEVELEAVARDLLSGLKKEAFLSLVK